MNARRAPMARLHRRTPRSPLVRLLVALALAGPCALPLLASHTPPPSSVTIAGSLQSELGCPGDWAPDCLRSWLQDPDEDGIYTFTTQALPAGSYEAKVAIDESWTVNYGAGGVQNGPNIPFNVPQPGTEIFFWYEPATHVLHVGTEASPRGDLKRARAHWVSEDTVLWNVPGVGPAGTVRLHYSPPAGLALGGSGVVGCTAIPLTFDPAG